MKRFIALTLALVMLCCCAAGCGSDTKEDTVMTVNGTVISRNSTHINVTPGLYIVRTGNKTTKIAVK